MGIPSYFTAVVLAAAATSVPDTVLSVKDARKGEYDDAVANAVALAAASALRVRSPVPLRVEGWRLTSEGGGAGKGTSSPSSGEKWLALRRHREAQEAWTRRMASGGGAQCCCCHQHGPGLERLLLLPRGPLYVCPPAARLASRLLLVTIHPDV